MCGTKLSLFTRNGSIWRVLPAQGEFCTALVSTTPSRENFVPFSPPRSQAGRVLYRTRGRDRASHDSTPARQVRSGRHRRNHRTWPRCRLRQVGRANTGSRGQRQTNFAHNFPRSLFKTAQKRCNSNDANSIFEQAAGELRAKLLRWQQGLLCTYSHAIRLGQISTNPENVAIPTMQIQCLNKLRGNCMRN